MYSIGILSVVFFALITTTNAHECKLITCLVRCPYGYDVDIHSCPTCSCLHERSNCLDAIQDYTCGSMDHQDCPNSHECQLRSNGLLGQCCLKRASSTTASPQSTTRLAATGTSTTHPTTTRHHTTARPHTTTRHHTTTKHHTTTRRALDLLLALTTGTANGSSASTTSRSGAPSTSTKRWFRK
jgi:hypothetical protein